jgi:stage III sporulation protein AD
MSLFGICIVVVLTAFLAVILRKNQPEQAISIEVLAGVLIMGVVLWQLKDVFALLEKWLDTAQLPTVYLQVLFKGVGLCLLTQLTADTCRDAGEHALAVKTEFAGKCFLLLLALPLFEQLLALITALIRGEGVSA